MPSMNTLIIGAGALGGLVAARMEAAGAPVCLAVRDAQAAALLLRAGLRVTGVGGAAAVSISEVAPLEAYPPDARFDLILLATKAHDAILLAPRLPGLLAPGGTLLPIQNGGVPQMLGKRLGTGLVLGGLSNLGATLSAPGVYEQRNAGHLLIGELAGGASERTERIRGWLARAVDVKTTLNFSGAVWSKLLLNCSVSTLGAIAGQTMSEYIGLPEARGLFHRVYAEGLRVALASGARPEPMLVDPVPPGWNGGIVQGEAHEAWLGRILQGYGAAKPSMLQDFERGRRTEIDFINGYVVDLGTQLGVPTPANAALVATVHAITEGRLAPDPALLGAILRQG